MDRYVLDGNKNPVLAATDHQFYRFFEDPEARRVARYEGDHVTISTVFLGYDHGFGDGPPILFETMVFKEEGDEDMDRCTTWAEAEEMHARFVAQYAPAGLDAISGKGG